MTNHANAESLLAALGARLSSHGFTVALTQRGLAVTNPKVRGCCGETAHPADTITCRPRRDDGDRMWFWTSWGEPISEAENVTDTALRVRGNLAGRASAARREQ